MRTHIAAETLHTQIDVLIEDIDTYITENDYECNIDAGCVKDKFSVAGSNTKSEFEIISSDSELTYAANTGDLQRVFALLYCEGVDPNARSASGATALIQATLNGIDNLGIIDLLLDRGVDVNAATSDGLTALMVATIKGHHAVVERLLEAGAEVRMQDMFRYNALAFAERLGHDAISELLQGAMAIAKEKTLSV
jgi:hypothetical protein